MIRYPADEQLEKSNPATRHSARCHLLFPRYSTGVRGFESPAPPFIKQGTI